MEYIVAIILGYLFGCSHMSYYISKIKNINIKEEGSKNYGASNTVALAGFKVGFLVFLHDLLKGLLAVVIANYLFEVEYAGIVAGIAAVWGHIFPFYLKFDGGKGFATFMGVMLAVDWKYGLCIMAIGLLLALISDYVVAGTFSIVGITPIYMFICHNWIVGVFFILLSLLIFLKHHENINNLVTKNGKEMKIRQTLKKK